jgi:hypothetical protein
MMMRGLTLGEKFVLAVHHEEALDPQRNYVDVLASTIFFAGLRGIRPEMFTPEDKAAFAIGWIAAVAIDGPQYFTPDEQIGQALIAAGVGLQPGVNYNDLPDEDHGP